MGNCPYCLTFTATSFAQDSIASVEKSIKGIQIGDNGLIFNYEFKLANKFALRTEAGYNVFIFTGDNNWTVGEKDKSSAAALPTFTIEPRWYYNLNRRVSKGKDITRNRANYVSLFVNYNSGWGALKFDTGSIRHLILFILFLNMDYAGLWDNTLIMNLEVE